MGELTKTLKTKPMQIQANIPLLERILGERADMIGSQYLPYKNHVYRVVNFCFAFHECSGSDQDKLVIAGCFHDLGMWPNDTVDYLKPSIALAKTYLADHHQREWSTEIELMIDLHHKFRTIKNGEFPLVEVFRKGDWVDASLGLRKFTLTREYVRQVQATFPNLGFHDNLLRLAKAEFRRNPLNPLPMMKW